MIDFRYHIVSIIAVFLALGVGVLMGSTVLDQFVADTLQGQVETLRGDLGQAREDIRRLEQEGDRVERLLGQLGPWATVARLRDRPVVFVYDGGSGAWRADVQQAFTRAGGETVGTMTLTDRWSLVEEGAEAELTAVVQEVTPSFEPGDDPAGATLRLLGERLLEPTGRTLLRALDDAGFLELDGVDGEGTEGAPEGEDAPWPPPGSLPVAFASGHPDDAPQPGWLATLARGTAAVSPTVVVAASPEDRDAVDVLRETGDPLPQLSTFDSGAQDGTEAGSVLALQAAIAGQGGHFGSAEGVRFFPEPVIPTPAPEPTP